MNPFFSAQFKALCHNGRMAQMNRRNFLKIISIGAVGAGTLGTSALVASCSGNDEKKSSTNKTSKSKDSGPEATLAAKRVSSDIYKTSIPQRIAFFIFDKDHQIVSSGKIQVTLTGPSGDKQEFKDVELREKEIKGRGIYSIEANLNEVGPWKLETNFKNQPLDLTFDVAEKSSAPGLEAPCPDSITPTDDDQLDAEILCTRLDGNCGLHKNSVSELLKNKEPFVVIFATPARCQTAYCGPVLDLTRDVANETKLPVIHIEIYKNETSNDVLDAVTKWNLPSEPWMFGITSEGKINTRLDGAFDKIEIEDLFARLT